MTGEYRLGDVRHVTASSELIKAELGWAPAVGFDEGMREFATAPPGRLTAPAEVPFPRRKSAATPDRTAALPQFFGTALGVDRDLRDAHQHAFLHGIRTERLVQQAGRGIRNEDTGAFQDRRVAGLIAWRVRARIV